MKKAIFFVRTSVMFLLFTAASRIPSAGQFNPGDRLQTQQLLIVLTSDWDAVGGTLYCFEKRKGKWVRQFTNAVVVGKKGLGLGQGIIPFIVQDAPVKKEGDQKSPAGIFKIGTAFGYADGSQAKWIKNPYVCATDTLICVDDVQSAYYNKLVNNDPGKSYWKSFELMHRKDNYYKWGLFVDHNADTPESGKGSCIFLHIWQNKKEGTVGCTAMKEKNLLKVLRWIDSAKHPLLVQFPRQEYPALISRFGFPLIKE